MIIKGNSLKYEFISIPAGRVSDEWTIIKNNDDPLPRKVSQGVLAEWAMIWVMMDFYKWVNIMSYVPHIKSAQRGRGEQFDAEERTVPRSDTQAAQR